MTTTTRKSLDEYLALQYPFQVVADPDGGYVVVFPDLPGCMTQAETMDEIPVMAEDARRAWLSVAHGDGDDIPLPSYPEEYSGKFNVRLPKSLHRSLAGGAKRNGVSLNQYIESLLARGDALDRVERRLDDMTAQLGLRAAGAEADHPQPSDGSPMPSRGEDSIPPAALPRRAATADRAPTASRQSRRSATVRETAAPT